MNSDSKAIGSMVKLMESEVTSAVATVIQDDFVDLTLYNHYYFYILQSYDMVIEIHQQL